MFLDSYVDLQLYFWLMSHHIMPLYLFTSASSLLR